MFKSNKKGFTLVELMTAMTIFSIVVVALMGIFSSAFKAQRKAFSKAYLLDNISYTTGYMSRILRMAKKDFQGDCIDMNHNYKKLDSSIRFLKYWQPGNEYRCYEFKLENGRIKIGRSSGQTPPDSAEFLPITAGNLVVENLDFVVEGSPQSDELQPKVTIRAKIRTEESKPQTINLQTTVSQRNLDIPY